MIEIINGIFSNRMLFIVGVTYGVPITIALIILFFVKSSRDERGRAIIGQASIIAMIVFIFLVNGFAKLSSHINIITLQPPIMSNGYMILCLQLKLSQS